MSGGSEKGTVFFPERGFWEIPEDYGLDYEDVYFPASDGTKLHGWYVDGTDGTKDTIVWFHGNAGNISHRLDNLYLLRKATGLNIFIFDYREYGRSEGEISKAGTFMDADGLMEYLTKERSLAPRDILLFGRSLGTALALHLAKDATFLGVALEAAFTSTQELRALYAAFIPPPDPSEVAYNNLENIHRVSSPVLFIHGQRDFTIPERMARQLFKLTPRPKFFYQVALAGHNDTYVVGERTYFEKWREFVAFCRDHRGED